MKNHSKKPTNTPAGHVGQKRAHESPQLPQPTPDQIRARAYEIYVKRGGGLGHDWDDWIAAERELKKR